MSQEDVIHMKSVDILDATSNTYKFRTNIDILNECFGANRSLYMQACFPQGKNTFLWEKNTNDKVIVWMPKLYGNSSHWKNSISEDRTIIYEVAENGLTTDWMDTGKHDLSAIRLVFVKESRKGPYVFAGVFINGEMNYLSHTYIRIATKVRLIGDPVTKVEILDDLRAENQITDDVKVIEGIIDNPYLKGVDKEAIVKARVNQSVFRDRLLQKAGKCCLCGVDEKSLLLASHIKPWSISISSERVDVNNGLLLCPNHDKLFDKGYISFDDEGKILISKSLSKNNLVFMNIHSDMKINLSDKEKEYMKYHRENIFVDSDKR